MHTLLTHYSTKINLNIPLYNFSKIISCYNDNLSLHNIYIFYKHLKLQKEYSKLFCMEILVSFFFNLFYIYYYNIKIT